MSLSANLQRLTAVPDGTDIESVHPSNGEIRIKPDICSSCSGTGWEQVPGNGVRPCRCRNEEQRQRLMRTRTCLVYMMDARY